MDEGVTMDDDDIIIHAALILCVLGMCYAGYGIYCVIGHEQNYGLGSEVTTTSEYEVMLNESFTGFVVRGEGWSDPALTIRNTNGEERRIATKFLEPTTRV